MMGSRASNTAGPSADWDLLVFSGDELRERDRRCDDLDVVHGGPSRHFLAEGQPAAGFTLSFENWEWRGGSGTRSIDRCAVTLEEETIKVKSAGRERLCRHGG